MRSTLALALLFALAGLHAGCGGDDGDTLKIGVILPMSQGQATYGEESWNGLQLAVDEIRAAQGDKGIKFELLLRDEKSMAQEANTQAKALMEVSGVHVLLGSVASSNTKAIGSAAQEMGVPCITPASTNDKLTASNEYLSRICFKDSIQAEALANFAAENGWKKVAVIVDQQNDYSTGLAENFKKKYEAGGGTMKAEYYKEGDKDFSAVIRGVADYAPDAIFFSGYYTDGGLMIKQAASDWKGLPIIAADGVDSPDFIPLLGDATNKIYFSTHFAPSRPDPTVQAFAKKYEARFGKAPGAMAALGYDVLFVLMDAARRADDPKNPESLRKAINATKGVVGITGTIDLTTADRTPRKDITFVKIENGQRSFLKLVKP